MCRPPPVPSVVVMPDVFLHVGLLQDRDDHDPGAPSRPRRSSSPPRACSSRGAHRAQRLAAYDLLGQRVRRRAARRGRRGRCGRLVDLVAAHDGPTVVVSEEELSLARPRQARRLVRALAGHRVHVVVGARDIARTLVSAWQQTIVNGGTTRWPDFVGVGAGTGGRAAQRGRSFHWRHDLLRVVDSWADGGARRADPAGHRAAAGRGRRARSAGPLRRRGRPARAAWPGAPAQPATSHWARPSSRWSVGSTWPWAGRLNTSQHRFVIEAGIRARLAGATARPLVLPAEHLAGRGRTANELVAELERRDLTVHGALSDLVPPLRGDCGPPPDLVEDADLLAATAGRAGLARARPRAAVPPLPARVRDREGRLPGPAEVPASQRARPASGSASGPCTRPTAARSRLVPRGRTSTGRRVSPTRASLRHYSRAHVYPGGGLVRRPSGRSEAPLVGRRGLDVAHPRQVRHRRRPPPRAASLVAWRVGGRAARPPRAASSRRPSPSTSTSRSSGSSTTSASGRTPSARPTASGSTG